jgi:hypothetical protein
LFLFGGAAIAASAAAAAAAAAASADGARGQGAAAAAASGRALLAAAAPDQDDQDLLPGWHADQQQPGWGDVGDAGAAAGGGGGGGGDGSGRTAAAAATTAAAAAAAAATTAAAIPRLELPLPAPGGRAAGRPPPNPAQRLAQQLALASAGGADVAVGPPGAATAAGTAGAVATRQGEQTEAERREHLRAHPRAASAAGGGLGAGSGNGNGGLYSAPQPRPQLGAEPFSPDMLITITEQLEQARTLANLSSLLAARGGGGGGGAPAAATGAPLSPASADLLPPPLSQAQLARANPLLGPLGPLSPKPRAPRGAGAEAWPDGYVAICAVVKDQARDLREWVEYHRYVGVRKIYVYDNNSTVPLAASVADHLRDGAVEYSYFVGRRRWRDLFRTTSQWWAYNDCFARFAHRHRWLAFIDVDEFIVFEEGATKDPPFLAAADDDEKDDDGGGGGADGAAADAAGPPGRPRRRRRALTPALVDVNDFMRDYERFGALAINWRIFGSGGHDTRPRGGVLTNYVACAPSDNPENAHVKVVANTAHALTVGDDPHTVVFKHAGAFAVDELGRAVHGARTPAPSLTRVALYHYVTKSRAEYGAKAARGSAAGNFKDAAFFDAVNAVATDTCPRAVDLGRRCCPSVLADLAAGARRDATERAAVQAEAIAAAWPAGGIAGDGVGGVAAGRAAAARAVAALPAPPGYEEEAAAPEEEPALAAFGAGRGGAGGGRGGADMEAAAAAAAVAAGGGGGDVRTPRAEAAAVDRLLDPLLARAPPRDRATLE